MSSRARQQAKQRARRARRAQTWRAQAVLGQLHLAEVEMVCGWLVHDADASQLDEIASRAVSVTEAVRDLHKLNEETALVVMDMVTVAIADDSMRADQGLTDEPDEALSAKLGEINQALFSRNGDR